MANISYGVNIIPKTNNAYTLGNSDYKWANIFTNQINGTDIASIISSGASVDISGKVDKTALLNAGITTSTYSTAFGGAFTVTTATDSNHTIPYAKATPTGVINKHKRYRVTINDTEYILESHIWFINNKFYNYLGDISKVYEHPEYVPGGNDSTIPFLITFDRDNNSAIEVYTTTAGTYTIKIETITDTFKKLPLELIYGSAYAPILQLDNTGSTFNGYSIGVNALVSKRGTVGIGHGNILKNDFVTALGSAHEVGGANSCAIGFNNITNSECNLGAGTYNIIESSNNYASTIGLMNHIYGHSPYSMAVGFRNTIQSYSQSAHAFGYWNINDGENSTSLGYSNCAFSDCTLAMGAATTASGKCQITLGTFNVIDATTSWVASTSYEVGDKVYINNRWYECITANSDATFTSSKWIRCKSKFLEILGNGDIDASLMTRSNARATDWDGNTYIKGNLYIGCNADSSGGTRVPHDIQVNGTSIVSNGVATIPLASTNSYGVTKIGTGLYTNSNGVLYINSATSAQIKGESSNYAPIVPVRQHESVFYGLAKAAGDSTQAASNNNVGYYTDTAKAKIQQMLGIQAQAWELIKEDTFTNVTEDSHTITTDSSGSPFALTDIFFMFETPKVTDAAAAKGTYGQIHFYYGTNSYFASESGAWTQEANGSAHGCMVWITQELGGLFIIRYTASTTTTNGAQWRTRYGSGFTSSAQGAQFFDSNKVISKIVIPTVTGTGHYKLYGKRQITL